MALSAFFDLTPSLAFLYRVTLPMRGSYPGWVCLAGPIGVPCDGGFAFLFPAASLRLFRTAHTRVLACNYQSVSLSVMTTEWPNQTPPCITGRTRAVLPVLMASLAGNFVSIYRMTLHSLCPLKHWGAVAHVTMVVAGLVLLLWGMRDLKQTSAMSLLPQVWMLNCTKGRHMILWRRKEKSGMI